MLAALLLIQAGLSPLDVEGVWLTANGSAQVEIVETEDSVRGEIIWYENYRKEQVFDENNPNDSARRKELLGLVLLENFEADDEKWRRGRIYDPTTGSSYRSAISRADANTLAVEGCLGFICRTQEWSLVPAEQVMRIERQPMTLPERGEGN